MFLETLMLPIVLVVLILVSVELFREWKQVARLQQELEQKDQELTAAAEQEQVLNKELLEVKQQMEQGLEQDLLTGLPNRKIYFDRLQQVLQQSKRYSLTFAILALNVDGLKAINDALGIAAGDQLLKELALRLQSSIRKIDTISRFGGDEFLFILPQIAKPETAVYVAQRLLHAAAEPMHLNGQDIYNSASIGIAIFPNDGDEVNVLIKNADHALRQAKARGRNNYQFYQAELMKRGRYDVVLNASLHSATLLQEMQIYYQPVLNIELKKIVSMQALLYWRHPDVGVLAFKDFAALAEQSGKMLAIGEWLLQHACQQFKIWQARGPYPQSFSVAVSLHQLENPHFIYSLTNILRESQIDPACLILEISETMVLDRLNLLEKSLSVLKQHGVQLVINDFGAGNFALQQLRLLPIDYLKITPNLAKDLTINQETQAIVKMIFALAQVLQIQVIADGVATTSQKEALKVWGCRLMQGPLFTQPLLAQEFTDELEKHIIELV